MQEPRRRSWLEQRLLSLKLSAALGVAVGCAAAAPAASPNASPDVTPAPALASDESAAAASSSEALPASMSGLSAEPPRALDETAKGDSGEPSASQAASNDATADLPRGTLVLHIGDSFAGSLGVPLGNRLRERGLRSVLKFQTSSYVPTWASGTELPEYVAHYSPDLVLITLGANEFELSAPDTRAGAVRRLVHRLGDRPCVWITPPRWKPDSGILAVIQANSAPCRFLDSDTVVRDLARKPDKIHPSDAAREVWADAVLSWLARERTRNVERPWELRQP